MSVVLYFVNNGAKDVKTVTNDDNENNGKLIKRMARKKLKAQHGNEVRTHATAEILQKRQELQVFVSICSARLLRI